MSVRRWAIASVVGTLGLGLGLQPATAQSGSSLVEGSLLRADDYASVPDGCANTLTGAEPGIKDVPADGAWRTIRLDRSGTLSSSTVRATSAVTGRISGDARGTTRVDAKIVTQVSARPTSASICSLNLYRAESAVGAEEVTVPVRSWLTVRGTKSSSGNFTGETGATSLDNDTRYVVRPGLSLTRLIPAGHYTLGVGIQSWVSVPANSTTPVSSTATTSTLVAVYPIGTRRTLSGNGLGFATAGHRNCTYNRVKVSFTSRARTRTKRITLYVNGDRRVVLSGRALQRSSIVLRKIPASSDGVVKAVIRTKSGARRVMRSTSWPCR